MLAIHDVRRVHADYEPSSCAPAVVVRIDGHLGESVTLRLYVDRRHTEWARRFVQFVSLAGADPAIHQAAE